MRPYDCASARSDVSPSQSSCSRRAPLPRWKRRRRRAARRGRCARAGNTKRRRGRAARAKSPPTPDRATNLGGRGGKRLAILVVKRERSRVGALALEPFGEIRRRRQRDKVRKCAASPRETSSTTCLMRKLPKLTPARPRLATGDRVEHRRHRPARIDDSRLSADRRDGAGYLAGQRHSTKISGSVDQRRMEKGVAATVGQVDAPP